MKPVSWLMGMSLLIAASPVLAQSAEQGHVAQGHVADEHAGEDHSAHGQHHAPNVEGKAQSVDQPVTQKKVIVKRVHRMDSAGASGAASEVAAVEGAPGTQCEGKIAETILDSESKVADGQVRKFKVTRCTQKALTSEQKIAELQTLRANVDGPNFPESDAASKAAFLQAIDARIAELKQPSS